MKVAFGLSTAQKQIMRKPTNGFSFICNLPCSNSTQIANKIQFLPQNRQIQYKSTFSLDLGPSQLNRLHMNHTKFPTLYTGRLKRQSFFPLLKICSIFFSSELFQFHQFQGPVHVLLLRTYFEFILISLKKHLNKIWIKSR